MIKSPFGLNLVTDSEFPSDPKSGLTMEKLRRVFEMMNPVDPEPPQTFSFIVDRRQYREFWYPVFRNRRHRIKLRNNR